MPSPHLWIPVERTRTQPVVTAARGKPYVREDVAEHSRALREAFNRSADRFVGKHDFDVATDIIVQITTAPGRSVASERQHLRNLGFEIVAFSDAPNVATARIDRDALPRFTKKLDRYAGTPKHFGKGNFGAIEAIAPVAVERKIEQSLIGTPANTEVSCLISLFGRLLAQQKEVIAGRIASELREAGKAEVSIHNFANGAVGVSADLTRAEMERISEQYMFVRWIESNAEVVIESAVQADPIPQLIQVDRVRCQTPVVVIDSGVNGACSLMAGLVLRSVNELPPGSTGPHLAHGTFVASRVVYGDDITSVLSRRASPWCPVIDVQVTGDDGVGNRLTQRAATLGEILQRVVPALAPFTKVFNLSLGVAPIADGEYSSLARLIDFLSREHQVLFVISAGNIEDPISAPPGHYFASNTRVLFPAESLLSLTVGSIAKYFEPQCVSIEREIAPFSRRGPGADRALKPELATHGGNVLFNGNSWTTSPRVAVYGLGRSGTHLEYSIGTSYSAPLVSQYAARLFDAYPTASPNLVRALLCHFAESVHAPTPGAPLRDHDFCGFGEPNVDNAMFAGEHATAYLFSGTILKDNYLFIPFYVPNAMADTEGTRLTIKGTVVFDPPVSLDDSTDYSLCRIAGRLRKRGAGGLHDVNIGGDEEDVLYPWNPLLHFQHTFRRGYAAGEWELRLRLMTRGELPDDFAQSFAMVIEVIDESGRVDVRNAVLSETQSYAPVVLRIAA